MDIIDLNSLLVEPFKAYNLVGYSNSFIKELLEKNETIHIIQCNNPDEDLLQLLKKDGNFWFRLPVCPVTQDNIKFIILITPMGKFYDYFSIKGTIVNGKFECPFTRISYNFEDLLIVKINTIKELIFYFELLNTYDHNEGYTFEEYMNSKIKAVSVESMEELENFIDQNIKTPVKIKCTQNFDYDEEPILRMIQNMYVLSLSIYMNETTSVFFTDNKLSELKSLCVKYPGELKIDQLSSFTFPNNLVEVELISIKKIDE